MQSNAKLSPEGANTQLSPEGANTKLSHELVANSFDMFDDFDIYTIEDTDYAERDEDGDIKEGDKYVKLALAHVLADTKKIVRVTRTGTQPKVIYKALADEGGHRIEIVSYDEAKNIFKNLKLQGLPRIKVGGVMRERTLWNIIEDNTRELRARRVRFISDEPDVFNTFSGYRLQPLKEFDTSLIKLHLAHWHNILCSGNDSQYDYKIKWCARLLKFPNERNRTGLVLLSKQGVGKNTFFTDHLINIIGRSYACYESNANNIFGEFNKKIENKHLVVCNEMVDADNASRRQAISYDRLKSTMTDPTISIRAMRTDAYDVENVFNLIIVSNNGMPFRIEDEDRRLVFLDVDNRYAALKDSAEIRNDPAMQKLAKERQAYFDALATEMKHPLFLQTLYSYLLSQYDPNWDPEHDKPLTKAKEVILERSVNPLQEWVEQNVKRIESDRWETIKAYTDYKNYCIERGHKFISNIQGFMGDLKQKYDIDKIKETTGKRKTYLTLTEEGKQRYAPLLTNDDESD